MKDRFRQLGSLCSLLALVVLLVGAVVGPHAGAQSADLMAGDPMSDFRTVGVAGILVLLILDRLPTLLKTMRGEQAPMSIESGINELVTWHKGPGNQAVEASREQIRYLVQQTAVLTALVAQLKAVDDRTQRMEVRMAERRESHRGRQE